MATVAAALKAFHVREGLPAHAGQEGWVDWVKVFSIPVPIPNPPARKRVLVHHDAHHLVTGFRTDEVGEAEVGAWALAADRSSVPSVALASSTPLRSAPVSSTGRLPTG